MGTKYNREKLTSSNDWSGYNADFVARSAARARMTNRSAHLVLSVGLFAVAVILLMSAPILNRSSTPPGQEGQAVVRDKAVMTLSEGDAAHVLILDVTVDDGKAIKAPVAVDEATWAACEPGMAVRVVFRPPHANETGLQVYELHLPPKDAAALTDDPPAGDTVGEPAEPPTAP